MSVVEYYVKPLKMSVPDHLTVLTPGWCFRNTSSNSNSHGHRYSSHTAPPLPCFHHKETTTKVLAKIQIWATVWRVTSFRRLPLKHQMWLEIAVEESTAAVSDGVTNGWANLNHFRTGQGH